MIVLISTHWRLHRAEQYFYLLKMAIQVGLKASQSCVTTHNIDSYPSIIPWFVFLIIRPPAIRIPPSLPGGLSSAQEDNCTSSKEWSPSKGLLASSLAWCSSRGASLSTTAEELSFWPQNPVVKCPNASSLTLCLSQFLLVSHPGLKDSRPTVMHATHCAIHWKASTHLLPFWLHFVFLLSAWWWCLLWIAADLAFPSVVSSSAACSVRPSDLRGWTLLLLTILPHFILKFVIGVISHGQV